MVVEKQRIKNLDRLRLAINLSCLSPQHYLLTSGRVARSGLISAPSNSLWGMAAPLVTSGGWSAWFIGVMMLMVYLVFAMMLYVLPPSAG